MNMVMAAVAVLVMIKTMVNSSFRKQNPEHFEEEEDFDYEEDEMPNQISDFEYEYLNNLLENENFDFQNFKIEDFENLDFRKLMTELNSNLEVKLAIMKNNPTLNELLLKSSKQNDFDNGEAASDS